MKRGGELSVNFKSDLLYSFEYEILEICADRSITPMEFDDYPYRIKLNTIAHWELAQEVAEYYKQKAEKDIK